MCKTTTATVAANERTRRIFPPCGPQVSTKTVTVTVFDPKKLIESRSDLQHAITQVGDFYNNLKATPGLPPAVVQDLSRFTFATVYKTAAPNEAERAQLGNMDFPFYLFHYKAPFDTSYTEIQELLEAHKIPMDLSVKVIIDTNTTMIRKIVPDAYKTIENDWGDELVLGFGFPANYHDPHNTGNCRKLGLVKIDAVLQHVPMGDTEETRFAGVIEHELGHMLALAHQAGTLMNEKYDRQFKQFNADQIAVIRDTLKILSP